MDLRLEDLETAGVPPNRTIPSAVFTNPVATQVIVWKNYKLLL
jgi:hypothetical protein